MLIGITGGIGSGKSAVSEYLRLRGETVICADETTREVVCPGKDGNHAIRELFGDSFFRKDGSLDREKLAVEVFSDNGQREVLEHALHPIIINRMFEKAKRHGGRVFLDAALLIQAGMHERVDYIWLVIAEESIRIARVMNRDNKDKVSVKKRIEVQMRDDDMSVYADEIIQNNSSIENLHERIEAIIKKPKYCEGKHEAKA